ncbi:MAG: response regulator transcription factor [Dehalococcoidales bacterium]|nr:response regulator transcription factor [Dehalococcoidales bacterium]
MDKTQVFVIDNNSLFRKGLKQAFSEVDDIELIGESALDNKALDMVADFSPEIALVDIGMPLLTGLDLARQMTRHSPALAVVILTPFEDDEQLFQTVKSGAIAYLPKDASAEDIISIVRRIHRGERPINEIVLDRPHVAEKVLKQFQDISLMGRAMETLATPLTPRELEILSYVAQGYMNKQVAYKLSISEQTIKNHLTSILRKLDANDRTQAVVMAMHYGWIPSRVEKPLQNVEVKAAADK